VTISEADRLIPSAPASGYGGTWIGWYLRVLLGIRFGIESARRIVIGAVGPNHDYEWAPATMGQKRIRRRRRST
jgi:hypothetical protein